MHIRTMIGIGFVLGLLASPAIAAAQSGDAPPWLPCPQCQSPAQRDASRARTAALPFDPQDLSGIWNQNRIQLDTPAPALTPLGQARYDATESEQVPGGGFIGKDPNLTCDPMGWPRSFTYNYGFEFMHAPNRLLQFLEWGHTWRTIWTDGRELPEDPPTQRWLGYSVGHWEDDTFIVESSGFDDRSWLSENRQDRRFGWPHSDQLRTRETYRRVDFNTIEVSLTITDPVMYTAPWVTTNRILRSPDTELWEYFCVPSEAEDHSERVRLPALGVD
jgi:hypothetical protein